MHEHSAFVLLDELLLLVLWIDKVGNMQLNYPFHTARALFVLHRQVNLSAEALY